MLWGCCPKIGEEKWPTSVQVLLRDGHPVPENDLLLVTLVQADAQAGQPEFVVIRPDGTRLNVLVFPQQIDPDGNRSQTVITLIDITENRQLEEKQAILSQIVQSSNDAIISKNLDGIIMSWNKAAEQIFGYTESEMIGKPIDILIPAYLQKEETTIIREIKAGRKVNHYQTIRIDKWGKEIPISLTISPIYNGAGEIIGASKIARDISERIQRDQIIQYQGRKLENLHAIGKIITERIDTPSLIEAVIHSTAHVAAADVGVCFYKGIDEQGRPTLSAVARSADGSKIDVGSVQFDASFIEDVFANRQAMKMEAISADPDICALFEQYAVLSDRVIKHCLAIPIQSTDKLLIGAMFFGYADSNNFEVADQALIQNIASLIAVTLENSRLLGEVNALNLRKNEFIALASHELKTPLTTTKGYLQILERAEIDQAGRRFLVKAIKQLDRINALISELLDISKIEAGKLRLHYEQFDLLEMILDVVETFHFSSQTHTIFVDSDSGDYTIHADKQRLEQVVINLITNAIKYSPNAHQVHVMLTLTEADVMVKVVDEGMGITRDQQDRVFSRFYQVEGTTKMTGLGLGLYLSKEIIERHGGTIGVISELGAGSTFYFVVPRNST